MDRELLEQMLGQGLSLAEIGRRLDKDPSTVGYWLKKYGLRAAGVDKYSPRGALLLEELEPLVAEGASLAQIAESVGRSKGTVRHWLAKYGLHTQCPTRGPRRPDAYQARAEGQKTPVLDCPRHGAAEHVQDARGSYRCRRCRADSVVRRRRRVKQLLVVEAGGRCRLCGYDRCTAALQFHHLDPAAKEFGLAQRGARSLVKLRAESEKCVLLCSNCHAEVEAGFTVLPSSWSIVVSDDVKQSVS
jgi:transposase-like protein